MNIPLFIIISVLFFGTLLSNFTNPWVQVGSILSLGIIGFFILQFILVRMLFGAPEWNLGDDEYHS